MKWQLTIRFVMLVLVLVGGVARMSAQTFTVDDIEYEVTNAGEVMAKYYYGDGGHVIIPETVTYSGENFRVTSIGTETFIGETGLLSIDLPAGLKSIGGRAFCNCSGLTSIDIPESVTSIGSGAFKL